MKRRIWFIALAIAFPLALIVPLRAARSWQPRELQLQEQGFDEISALTWTKEGILLARVVGQGRSDAFTLANWSGESVAVRVWQARVASLSRDGTTLAKLQSQWAQGNGRIEMWNVPSERKREGTTRTLQILRPQRKDKEVTGTPTIALSPDGSRLAWNDFAPKRERVVLADARTGRPDTEFLLPQTDGGGTFMSPFVYGLSFSPDGRELAVVTYDALRILDAQTGTLRRWWHQPQFPQSSDLQPVWSPDGQTIALIYTTADPESSVRPGSGILPPPRMTPYLWIISARTGKTVRSRSQVSVPLDEFGGVSLAFSPDGEHLAWATASEAVMMNVATGAIERHFPIAQTVASHAVTFAPNGDTLAVATQSKITLWRLK